MVRRLLPSLASVVGELGDVGLVVGVQSCWVVVVTSQVDLPKPVARSKKSAPSAWRTTSLIKSEASRSESRTILNPLPSPANVEAAARKFAKSTSAPGMAKPQSGSVMIS